MELREANRILQSVRSALAADGIKLPAAVETDGIMLLLGKLDAEKYLAPKIARAGSMRSAKSPLRDQIVFCRALAAVKSGIKAPVSVLTFTTLHKTLFGDTNTNAGKLRNVQSSDKNGNAYTDPKYISGSLKSIISKMNGTAPAPVIGKDDFASYLTHYMRELIILHPFEHGAEITLRIFMILFCKLKGFALCYNRVAAATVKIVEDEAFRSDDVTPMFKMLGSCLSYERTTIPALPQKPRTKRDAAPSQKPVSRAQKRSAAVAATKQDRDDELDIDDAKLKRIIRLQQKISRLNDQLMTELTPKKKESDE